MTNATITTADLVPAQVGRDMAPDLRQLWADYAAEGLVVFPLVKGGKNPGTDFGIRWQKDWLEAGRRDTFPELWDIFGTGTYGLWLATGQCSKRVVLDLDKPEAETYWRDRLGEAVFNAALKVTSGRGKHLHFKIREDDDREWASHSDEEIGFDFRGDGGGVVLPPSIHRSGRRYTWLDGELQDAPECLRKENQPKKARLREEGGKGGGTTLAELLLLDPVTGERGNNWLARVAGHIAKIERRYFDRYEALLRNINWASADPIDDYDFDKTIRSIWNTEQSKGGQHEQANGWLVGDGSRLFTLTEVGQGEDKSLIPAEWANFDVKVSGIATYADGTRRYLIDLHAGGRVIQDIEVDLSQLSTDPRLNGWLAAYGAGILPPSYDKWAGHPNHARFMRYMTNQDAPESLIVDHLGWNRQHRQYLTNTGVIVAGAVAQARFGPVRPSRRAIDNSRVNFGFEVTPAEAVEVLRQVLTFHDETVASVVASWMVMRVLNGHYRKAVQPTLQIEGKSGSAKSKFTQMLVQLILGSTHDGGSWTRATAEDAYAANAGGAVWFDDKDIDKDLQELIRIAATNGSKAKKSAGDFTKNGDTKFQAATILSSEGMTANFNAQQANRERSIRVEYPNVRDRKSLRDPSRPQWEADIEPLWFGRFEGEFFRIAGSLLSALLAHVDAIGALEGSTREEQGHGLLRAGARVLASVLDDPAHIERVDAWIGMQESLGAASTVTLEVVPEIWADRGKPTIPGEGGFTQPVFFKDGRFHVNSRDAAAAWKAMRGKHYTSRDESIADQDGITREMKEVSDGSKQVKTGVRNENGGVINNRYWIISERYTKAILDRATGAA